MRCPRCDRMLVIVPYPTHEETRAAAAAGSEEARSDLRGVEVREAFLSRAHATELRLPQQLPPIRRWTVVVDWDFEERDGEKWTILRHGDRELWRELAYWEGYERFAVAEILRRRYGRRLRGLQPTSDANVYLLGDRLWTIEAVDRLNERLSAGRPPT